MNTYNINCGVGIMGVQFISHSKDPNSTSVKIKKTGSFTAYHIPAIIVFCEDNVAESILENALAYRNVNRGSFKFRKCGSWENIIISLAGCLLYSQELRESGNTKSLEVVGVIDGDISEEYIANVISKTYKGDGVPDELKEITKKISQFIISFKLPNKILLNKKIKGKPELNLKEMIEEIDKNSIEYYFKKRKNELSIMLEKATRTEVRISVENEIDSIEKEINETIDIVEISKSIGKRNFKVKSEHGIIMDYHNYFKKLQKRTEENWFTCYRFTNLPIFLVYRIVSKFNKSRWEEYIEPVVDFLVSAKKRQTGIFSHNTYNNQIID